MRNPGQRKAKRASKLKSKAENTMAKAQGVYKRGATNLADSSPMAKDKGMQQQLRAERLGNKAKRQMAKSERLSSEASLYKKAGGSYKKATMGDVTKFAAGGSKPSAGAIRMAKGILARAGKSTRK